MASLRLLATLILSSAIAYAQVPSSEYTTTSIPPAAVQTVLVDSGEIPASEAPAAATLVAQIANQYQADFVKALNKSGVPALKLTDPEAYYSYGRSPPVYPSPQAVGDGEWADAYAKARAMVAQMTDEEKNNITTPSPDNQGCSGFTGSVLRLGFPGICLNDAENGVRIVDAGNVSGFPAEISIGASWDKGLAYQRALYMGQEFKAKGVNVALGPVIGPLGRMAKGGRNWEGFSNDPYLAGSLVDPTVQALQQNVIACAKHFIVNEQETSRTPFLQGLLAPLDINVNNSVSSNVDDRTMHEMYLWPFYDAVKAGVGSVMCSYNRVNNSYACQNSKTMNGLLKTELAFSGFVLSDWLAQHTGVASATAGLDLVMPLGIYWGNNTLATAVQNGSLSSSRLDDMATRILASWYRYAPFDTPGVTPHKAVDARQPFSSQIILQAAVEGHVLVKNEKAALPLKRPKSLSLFGWDAISGYNTSASDPSLYAISLENTRQYTDGSPFGDIQAVIGSGAIEIMPIPAVAFNGTMIVGGGSGGITPASMVSPYDAILRQTATDGTMLHTDFTATMNPQVPESDACLVLINAQSSEAADRSTLADEYSDTYVSNIASQCANTIVVIHNAGIRLVDRWIDHPNVTAAMYAHLPGQASGDALVEVLYGRQSPSGRLPYTVAKNESDYGKLLNPTLPTETDPQYSQSNFDEGVFIDYRHFIHNNITPRFEFGYGLSYTSFSYSNISIRLTPGVNRSAAPPDADQPASEGGLASLYDVVATAAIDVVNTGSVAGAEVAQLYLGIPNSGVPKALRGFDKHWMQPGESASYVFPLRRRDLSMWDVEKQMWMMQSGEYKVYVGKSVLDIQLQYSLGLQ